jgi:hypothetical protein
MPVTQLTINSILRLMDHLKENKVPPGQANRRGGVVQLSSASGDGRPRPEYNAFSMRSWLRKSWPVIKAVVAVAIVVAIGRQFVVALRIPERGLKTSIEDLLARLVHPGWLVAAGVLYILGLGFSAYYWYRLLRTLKQRPFPPGAVRAYYMGHMGKYLPGKAWALFLRASLAHESGVRIGIAVMTSFYEVLTTMASGALLAALLFAVQTPTSTVSVDWRHLKALLMLRESGSEGLDYTALSVMSLLLLAPVGIPLVPFVFNRIVFRLSKPFRNADSGPVPRIHIPSLFEGLAITAGGWLFLGASLWAILCSVAVEPLPLTGNVLAYCTAALAFAYVAGFIIVLVPNGLGVREFFLTLLLVPQIESLLNPNDSREIAILVVLLLRLIWTAAEVVIVGLVYWLPSVPRTEPPIGDSVAQGDIPENRSTNS